MLASVGPAVLPANNNTTIIEIREEFNKIVSTLNRPVAARQTTEAGPGSLVLGGASKRAGLGLATPCLSGSVENMIQAQSPPEKRARRHDCRTDGLNAQAAMAFPDALGAVTSSTFFSILAVTLSTSMDFEKENR